MGVRLPPLLRHGQDRLHLQRRADDIAIRNGKTALSLPVHRRCGWICLENIADAMSCKRFIHPTIYNTFPVGRTASICSYIPPSPPHLSIKNPHSMLTCPLPSNGKHVRALRPTLHSGLLQCQSFVACTFTLYVLLVLLVLLLCFGRKKKGEARSKDTVCCRRLVHGCYSRTDARTLVSFISSFLPLFATSFNHMSLIIGCLVFIR